MAKTSIDWCDAVWNPSTGCSKVSEGCRNCYAERVAKRFWKGRAFSDVQIHPERLKQPYGWKPSRIFVDSMSDLFHPNVPDAFIGDVWAEMRMLTQHVFIILTKRPERMRELVYKFIGRFGCLTNVILGVSVENQNTADSRIPLLLETPGCLRAVSIEPMLGPITLEPYLSGIPRLDWVICGGESGPAARPMHPSWPLVLAKECENHGTPFFFKQWGEWREACEVFYPFQYPVRHLAPDGSQGGLTDAVMVRCGKKEAGHNLGKIYHQYPSDGHPIPKEKEER